MYGDFSRLTFDRSHGYTAVWNQQGRIQLDADFNEQTAILLDYLRTLATDFIGPAGANHEHAGFDVSIGDDGALLLTRGHYYVAGIRCEVPVSDLPDNKDPYRPHQPELPTQKPFLVYLQVWERSINALQQPILLEPALGPTSPDTTVRTKVEWSLGTTAPSTTTDTGPDTIDHDALAEQFGKMNDPDPRPRLHARVTSDASDAGPEQAATTAGYSGLENQLYRVEIHRGNVDSDGNIVAKDKPTFKWSRDNGSVEFVFTGYGNEDHTQVVLNGAGLPGRPQLEKEDFVEVVGDSWKPFGAPGRLYKVVTVDREAHTVTLDEPVHVGTKLPALLRRWESVPITRAGSLDPFGIPVDDQPFAIEGGIEIGFTNAGDAAFRRGDYWLIPARAATRTIYGATTDSGGAPPYGPQRHYAPLAQINPTGPPSDLRTLFTQLAWPLPKQAPQ
jgi:hypothetical protein